MIQNPTITKKKAFKNNITKEILNILISFIERK